VNAVPEGYWLRTYLGVTVAVGQFHYFRDTRLFSAPAGSRFVGFGISIRNRNDSIIRVSPATVTLLDHTGHEYRHDRATFDYWLVPLQSLNATPNLLISGGMVFLIPEDSSPAQVTYDARPFGPIVTVDLAGPPIPY
ncbi:MAG: DUF4352 domain-containing protein, partial [Anaerolineae bacterium]|nr:DUF4352 domain-containing protein [Anaerolineae bacterium]